MKTLKRLLGSWIPQCGINILSFHSKLYAKVIRANGKIEYLGLIAQRLVTTAGVQALVDAFQGTFTLSDFKYHGCGTGTGAEAVGDTALGTPSGSRVAGSQTEGGSANIYRSVGTISFSGTVAVTEHGLFSALTSGTLWDRSVFSAINVNNGDSIQFTYDLTVNAGG